MSDGTDHGPTRHGRCFQLETLTIEEDSGGKKAEVVQIWSNRLIGCAGNLAQKSEPIGKRYSKQEDFSAEKVQRPQINEWLCKWAEQDDKTV